MGSPVLPLDTKLAAVPGQSICRARLNLLVSLPKQWENFITWMVNPDGGPTDAFKIWLGQGVTPVGTIQAPQGVSATDGTMTDRVRISWQPSALATYYLVFRSITNDPVAAAASSSIGSPTTTTFDDLTGAPNTNYYYFIQAFNGSDHSALSASDQGHSDPTGSGGTGIHGTSPTYFDDFTWPVPVEVTSIDVELWGACGGGGGGAIPPSVTIGTTIPLLGGGGGGSGEYRKVTGISVTPLQVLTGIVGRAGAGGVFVLTHSPSNGGNGETTFLKSGTVISRTEGGVLLVKANGGYGGHGGSWLGGSFDGQGGKGGSGGENSAGSNDAASHSGYAADPGGTANWPPTKPPAALGGKIANPAFNPFGTDTPGGLGGVGGNGEAGSPGCIIITW
jgi:hypothetical protein